MGTEFMPPLDEGAIAINVVRLPNASLDGSVQVATFIEKRLRKFPEVETVVSKTGRAEISEDPMGPEQTDVLIMLKPRTRMGRAAGTRRSWWRPCRRICRRSRACGFRSRSRSRSG